MKNRLIVFFLLILSFHCSWGQRGKDGAGNITAANTIVNIYTPLTASVNAGVATISVGSTAGFAVGDLIFIIQMQGATVNAYSNFPWIDPTMGMPNDTSMGYIQNYNNCGNHEFAQINSVLSGTSFSLDCALMKNYSNTGNVQVVRVPRYTTLSVSGAGNITCPPWNGITGGVAVVEVETNATLSSVPSFNVSNKGFRGGGVENASTISGANKFGSTKGVEGGYKGESIAGDTNTYKSWSVVFCKGAIANGGGGGTAHNAGGGGGANGGNTAAYNGYGNPTAGYTTAWNLESPGFAGNVSSGGGRGGYTFSSSNQNPNTFGPGSGGWSGDGRRNNGGFGGRPLDYSTGRLFIGGGGGTGDSNDNYGAAAGNGGGMVYVLCYGNITGAGTILADGGNGGNTIMAGGCSGRDGASGGGGGGTIVLDIVGTTNLTAAPALLARGGSGGNQNFGAPCINTEAYGPGAGGGGGYISYTGALPLNAVNGGTNGIVSGNSGLIRTNFPPNGATMGGAGSMASRIAARTITATPTTTICVNNSATLFAGTNASPATINWYSTIAGGSPIGTGSPYTTSVITVPGTYTVYAGYCQGGTYRVPSVITVITGPTLTVNSASICAGQTATLSATGATTYTWSTGAFTSSISVNPVATTVYTVSGTIATCTAAITTTVSMLSAPVLAAPPVNICNGQTATLTAAGATSYTWSTGGTGASITVTPAINTTYTVTGSNGACTSSITTNVTVNAAPVVTSNTVTICSGQTATLTGAGATSYTWSTGPTTSSITVSPPSSTNYTVTGSNGTCTNTAIASVIVVPSLTVTATSATICQGGTATLTAGGAATYTWSTSQTTTSISVSPGTTTTYTVIGSSGTCSSSATGTVSVNANPTVVVNSANICNGQTATLTAAGATSYTWSTGGTGASITVTPAVNTTYTVTGNIGACTSSITTNVTVNAAPVVTSNTVTICSGQTATLTGAGAISYTWSTGPTTSSITVSPPSSTNYTVTGSNGTCINTAIASVIVVPSLTVTATSATICQGGTATLTAGGAATYTWSTSQTTTSVSVSPGTTTTYTVIGSSGTCSSSATGTVYVNANPTITVNSATICSGQTATLNAIGAASFTWNPGGLTGSSVNVNPVATQVYTVIGNNASNCSGNNNATVTVISTPTITATSATVCSGQSATLTAAGGTNYTWTPSSITSATLTAAPATTTNYTILGANGTCTSQSTATITIGSAVSISINQPTICAGATVTLTATSPATSYTWNAGANTSSIVVTPTATTAYSVTGTSGGCSASGATTVYVNSNPTITVNSSTICSGQTATLNALGGTSYTWNPGGLTGASVNVSPGATQIYTLTGENAAGCSSIVNSTVTVTGSAALSVTSASICTGQTATLVASGATNYTWMPGGTTSPTLTNAPATTTTFTVLGANGTCTAQATATITVGSAVSISINQPTICIGETITLTATSPATTYTWNTGANSNSIIVTPTITTSYSVSGTSGGCSAAGNTTVFVSGSPTITATSATVCTGQSATLTASGATNYTWSPGSVVSSSLTAAPATTTNYTVLGATGNCTAQATATITIGSAVSISVNQPTICSGTSVTLTATSPATSYTWSTGATTSSIVVSPTVTTIYSVNGTSGSCNATGSGSVTVNSTPTISIGGGTSLCSGQTTTLTAGGANTYTWEPGTIFGSSVVVSPSTNTTYSVTGTNFSGCNSNTTITVAVSAAPSISITAPSTVICAGETASLTASGAGTYTWQPGGIVSTTLNVAPLTTQNYTVLSASGTCTVNSVITVSVNAPSSVSITPNSVPLVCNGSSVTLVASGASSYTWTPGNIVSNAISVSPSVFTTYTVTGGTGNCLSTAVQQVSVTSGINFTVNPTSIILCSGTRTTITAIGAQNYVWLPGNYTGSSVTINPSASVIYTVIGSVGSCTATKTVNVSLSNVTANFVILNNESDNFGAIQFQNISSGNNSNHWYFSNGTDTYVTDPAVYFGDPGTYVACLYVKNTRGCSDTLCKAVTVGCAENVVFVPNTFSPNDDGLNDVFKVVTLPQCILKYKMSIFNSWGQQVFTSDKFDQGWDGTFKGQPADDNVYSYILEYTMDSGKAYRKTGHVMLFK